MLDRLVAFFRNPENYQTPLPEADARHALGALMVRAAKADKAYLFEEVEQIDKVLAARNGLNPVEAAKMRASCEKLEEQLPKTKDLAVILKNAISEAEKEATVAALWSVVFADGVEHEDEDELLHQIESVLGVAPAVARRLHDQAVLENK
jgi:uncharacterized tellurite resistance protein B-like protein